MMRCGDRRRGGDCGDCDLPVLPILFGDCERVKTDLSVFSILTCTLFTSPWRSPISRISLLARSASIASLPAFAPIPDIHIVSNISAMALRQNDQRRMDAQNVRMLRGATSASHSSFA
jgi:hypothetical protein